MDPKQKPSEPIENDTGRQKDDNIDDLGRRPDGTMEDQPGIDLDRLTEDSEKLERD